MPLGRLLLHRGCPTQDGPTQLPAPPAELSEAFKTAAAETVFEREIRRSGASNIRWLNPTLTTKDKIDFGHFGRCVIETDFSGGDLSGYGGLLLLSQVEPPGATELQRELEELDRMLRGTDKGLGLAKKARRLHEGLLDFCSRLRSELER